MVAFDDQKIYPCDKCGKLRSKNEGGQIFTVCDKCWNKYSKEKIMTAIGEFKKSINEAEKSTKIAFDKLPKDILKLLTEIRPGAWDDKQVDPFETDKSYIVQRTGGFPFVSKKDMDMLSKFAKFDGVGIQNNNLALIFNK